ncbi:unnamed protein product [Closterium sp. Yama58-4]|nr:unnamed protein product [Closterium sp. Yama58-4]
MHGRESLGGSSKGAAAEDVENGDVGRKPKQQQKEEEVQVTSKQLEMLQQANDEIARGRYMEAIAIYNKALSINPTSTAGFMARAGTYFKMNKPVEVDMMTMYGDIMRLLIASGASAFCSESTTPTCHVLKAIVDYSRVIDLHPSNAEALRWRGILSFNLKDYYAAEKDFQQAIRLDPSQSFVFRGLALAIGGSGRWRESLAVFAEGVRRHPQDADLWHSKGRAHKELGEVEQAIEALQRALQIRKAAIRYAREGLQLDSGDMELVHALASSLHALGDFAEAMRKYQTAMALQPRDQEGQVLQHSIFYQRKVLAYTIARLQQPLSSIRFDWDFTAEFREAWTNSDPTIATLPGYQPLSVTSRQLQRATLRSLPRLSREALDLIEAADRIGQRAHYHCDAFMPNRQQLRMAGLAALDVMQQLFRKSSSSRSKGAGSGVLKGWRDVYEVITRWRQIADPTAAILWNDQLKKSFAQGVRSSTPIKVWDLQTVKYYPVFNKSFEAMREALLESEQAFTNNQPFAVPRNTRGDMIARASDLQALHQAVGKDFLVQAPCYSHAVPGYAFPATLSIRLPRYSQYTPSLLLSGYAFPATAEHLSNTVCPDPCPSHEVSTAVRTDASEMIVHPFLLSRPPSHQALCAAVLDAHTEAADPYRYRQRIQDAILRLGYFWFQLMPLTRGSAMVGLVSILGLSMAAHMQTTALIPHGVQVG